MGELSDLLRNLTAAGRVCLDTSIFIYAFERHPHYGPSAQAVFQALSNGDFEACASVLAAGEVFTGVKKVGDDDLLMRYRDIFHRFPGLTLVNADLDIMEQMAELRAEYGVPTPDAIHLATALTWHAAVFLTNDVRLKRVEAVEVLILPTSPSPQQR